MARNPGYNAPYRSRQFVGFPAMGAYTGQSAQWCCTCQTGPPSRINLKQLIKCTACIQNTWSHIVCRYPTFVDCNSGEAYPYLNMAELGYVCPRCKGGCTVPNAVEPRASVPAFPMPKFSIDAQYPMAATLPTINVNQQNLTRYCINLIIDLSKMCEDVFSI